MLHAFLLSADLSSHRERTGSLKRVIDTTKLVPLWVVTNLTQLWHDNSEALTILLPWWILTSCRVLPKKDKNPPSSSKFQSRSSFCTVLFLKEKIFPHDQTPENKQGQLSMCKTQASISLIWSSSLLVLCVKMLPINSLNSETILSLFSHLFGHLESILVLPSLGLL